MIQCKREGFLQISRMILSKEATEPRDEIHNVLFELGIHSTMKHKQWLSLEEIAESVSHELGVERYPLEPLRRAASRLKESKRIQAQVNGEGEVYALEEERAEMIETSKEEVSNLHDKVTTILIESVKGGYGDLTSKETDMVLEVFELTLSSIFAAMENASLAVLLGEGLPGGMGKEVRVQFGKHLGLIESERLRRIVREKMRNLILEPTEESKLYFVLCASNSFLLKLLNMDPECQSLQRKLLSEYTLYLDTNILVSTMFEGDDRCAISREILNSTSKLGVKFLVTTRTLDELDKVIERSDKIYSRQKPNSKSRYYTPENTMIQTFVRYAEPRGDRWDTFIGSHKQFRSYLLGKYHIDLDQRLYGEILQHEKIDEVSEIVAECSRSRLAPKSEEVIEHDAYHFLVIDYLRNELSSNKIWFLSHDSSFDCVNQAFMKLEGNTLPCSVLCSSWLEIIFPFLSPDVSMESFETLFAKTIGSDFFAVTKALAFGNLTGFFAPFWNDQDLTDEDYVAILEDQMLKRIVAEWKESDYSSDFDSKITERIASLVDARKDNKLALKDKEIEDLRAAKESLESKLLKSESMLSSSESNTVGLKESLNGETKKRELTAWISQGIIFVLGSVITILLFMLINPDTIYETLALLAFGGLLIGVMFKVLKWLGGREV